MRQQSYPIYSEFAANVLYILELHVINKGLDPEIEGACHMKRDRIRTEGEGPKFGALEGQQGARQAPDVLYGKTGRVAAGKVARED